MRKIYLEIINNRVIQAIVLLCILIVYFLAIKTLFEPVFGTRDDEVMRRIVAGYYTNKPDGHAIFIGVPLSFLLSFLYKLNSSIQWYGIVWSSLVVICSFLVINNVLKLNKSYKKRIIYSLLLLMGIFTPVFIVQQFTVLSGILCGTAVYMVVARKRTIAIVMLAFGYLIRSDVFFASIPFVLLFLLYTVYTYLKEKEIKNALKQIIPYICSIVLIACIGICCEKVTYSSNQWREYSNFNSARSSIYDYYDLVNDKSVQHKIKKMKLSDEEYYIITNYQIALDDKVDTKLLKKVSDYLNEKGATLLSRLKYAVIKNIKMGIKDYWYFNVLIIGIIIGIIYLKPSKKSIALILTEVFREALYLFLLFKNRLPERVYIAISFIVLMGLVSAFVRICSKKNLKKIHLFSICCISMVCVVGIINSQLNHRKTMINMYQQTNNVIYKYCENHKNKQYFVFMPTNQYVFKETEVKNAILIEPFLTKSEIMNAYTKKVNAKDLSESVYEHKNYKLIIPKDNYSKLNDYYISRYKTKLSMDDTITINKDKKYLVVDLKKKH